MYENMSIHITSREELRKKTAKLEEKQYFLQNVRSLRIWGRMCQKSEEREYASEPLRVALAAQVDAELGPSVLPIDGEEEIDNDWSPLVSLIKNCENLTDLIWACVNRLPPCLLQAIEEKHPNCRLDLRIFRFKSVNFSDCADEHERKLFQSPLLHSLSARPSIFSDSQFDGLHDAIKAAPKLKHVRIIPTRYKETPGADTRTEEWKGFQPPLDDTGKKSLSSLMLLYPPGKGLRLDDLLKWSDCIDLSRIQFLTLVEVTDPELITHLRQEVQFSSIEMLDVDIGASDDESDSDREDDAIHEVIEPQSFTAAADLLFEHLKPLKDVRLSGYMSPSLLETIFKRHGSTLRNIALNPTFGAHHYLTPDEIQKMQHFCRELVHLEIAICLDTYTLNNSNLSDFCPNLNHLQELVCLDKNISFPGIIYKNGKFVKGFEFDNEAYDDGISYESSDEWYYESPLEKYLNKKPSGDQKGKPAAQERIAERIWSVIRKEKEGDPLKALHLIQFRVNHSKSPYIQSS
jgi:hypothetical protein